MSLDEIRAKLLSQQGGVKATGQVVREPLPEVPLIHYSEDQLIEMHNDIDFFPIEFHLPNDASPQNVLENDIVDHYMEKRHSDYGFISRRLKIINSISDGAVHVGITRGETGCDSDDVVSIDLVVVDGCFYIGEGPASRHVSEGMEAIQSITIAARAGDRCELDMLTRAFRTIADWLDPNNTSKDEDHIFEREIVRPADPV